MNLAKRNLPRLYPGAIHPASQRGVALLTVLLLAALVTIILVSMTHRQRDSIARTSATAGTSQALAYALGAEAFARQLLYQDFIEDNTPPKTDSFSDIWATANAPFEIEGGALQLRIFDAQAKFNINGLALGGTNPAIGRMRNLVVSLGGDPALVDAIKDWIDADDEATGFGVEDSAYLLREPAYRAANQSMLDLSEMRLTGEEPDPDLLREIEKGVIALPSSVKHLNVNTATAEALMTLSPSVSLAEAQAIAESERNYEDPAQFLNDNRGFGQAVDTLSVASDYFVVYARVDYGGATVHLKSLLQRDPSSGVTRLLARNLGDPWFGPATVGADSETPNN